MNTVSNEWLCDALRASARGSFGSEAAIELLLDHRTWLRRNDFLDQLIEYAAGDADDTITHAWIAWEHVPAFLTQAHCSGSEGRILRLAAELTGVDTAVPLVELLAQLDDTNSGLVLDAIAHVLTRGGRR